MSELSRILLVLALLFSATARAESSLQGLEMDVMNPGESAARATSRIALPRMALPSPAEQDLPGGIDSERNARAAEFSMDVGPSVAREATPEVTPPDVVQEAASPPR